MKKTTTIKLPKQVISKLNVEDLTSQCQSVIEAKKMPMSILSYTCLAHHLPNAITEVARYIFMKTATQPSMLVSHGAKSLVGADEMLGKIQTDKSALTKFVRSRRLNSSIPKVIEAWTSNDKDNSLIFSCKPQDYYQALTEITKVLILECGAITVRPMKLRKYRVSLDDRKDIQDMYSRTSYRVSHIAKIFKLSPTSADAFCIKDASRHPELFLTNEEVERYNSVFRKEKKAH